MQFALFLVSSSALLAVALGAVGYAPAPQVAPAPTSYGYPQQQSPQAIQPVFVPQGNMQNAFNAAPRPLQPSPFNNQNQLTGNAVAPSLPGTGPVSSLTSEDDWENIITARGVKTLRGNRRH